MECSLIVSFILLLTSVPISYASRSLSYPLHKPDVVAQRPSNKSAGFALPIYHLNHPKVQKLLAFSPIVRDAKTKFLMVLSFGNPRVSRLLVLDTGSDICWVSEDGIYNRSSSSSLFELGCKDGRCRAVPNPSCSLSEGCHFGLTYADGTQVDGDVLLETFYLDDLEDEPGAAPTDVEFPMAFGLATSTSSRFKNEGVVGMNFGDVGLLTSLQVDKFSACFPDPNHSTSSYVLLGDDALLAGECTSLSQYYTYHLVFHVDSIKIAGVTLSKLSERPSGAYFTFDTGAEQSYLHPVAMDAVVETLRRSIKDEEVYKPDRELCYKLKDGSSFLNVDFSFQLEGGGTLQMSSLNIWEKLNNSESSYCLAMQRSRTSKIILGMTQMLGKNFGFDRTNHKLCYRDYNCALT